MTLVDPPEPADRELTPEEFVAGLDDGWDPPDPEPEPAPDPAAGDVEPPDPPEPDDPPAPAEPAEREEPSAPPAARVPSTPVGEDAPTGGADLPLFAAPDVRGVPSALAVADEPRDAFAPVTRADLEAIGREAFQLEYPLRVPGSRRLADVLAFSGRREGVGV